MRATPYVLVLVSAFTHAWWNYLFKRHGGGQLFIGLSKVSEAVLFAPVFLVVGWSEATTRAGTVWPLALIGAALTLSNYVLLAMAYRRGELSLVYPVSRGGILLFIPLLGFAAFGERITPVAVVSFGLIVAGMVSLQLPALDLASLRGYARRFASGGAGFALLAAAAAAGYTVWDKHAVGAIAPFTYFYAYTALVALAYGGYILRVHGPPAARREWHARGWAILQVAALNTVTYLLVLLALRDGTSSYVIALRQLSIAFGALLAWRLLQEPFGPARRVGVGLIVGGSLLLRLAG